MNEMEKEMLEIGYPIIKRFMEEIINSQESPVIKFEKVFSNPDDIGRELDITINLTMNILTNLLVIHINKVVNKHRQVKCEHSLHREAILLSYDLMTQLVDKIMVAYIINQEKNNA